MKNLNLLMLIGMVMLLSCQPPLPKEKSLSVKNNYIILLDLSDRLIVQDNQPERDKKIVMGIYDIFAQKAKKELYIRSRDEIKVVIAHQRGDNLKTEIFEDRLYLNLENESNVLKRKAVEENNTKFSDNLDTLYQKAAFSKRPSDYYGADIWKYVYEDLKTDFITDTLSKNFLIILTDGYPIVGKNKQKLKPIKNQFTDLHVVLIEASPRDKDNEWDSIMNLWTDWFNEIGVDKYSLIKRKAISKEIEELKDVISGN